MPPQIRESSCFDCSYSLPWMTMGFPSLPLQLQQWENHSSHRRAHTVLVVSHFFFLISHPCQILQISLENEYQMKMCSKQTHLKRSSDAWKTRKKIFEKKTNCRTHSLEMGMLLFEAAKACDLVTLLVDDGVSMEDKSRKTLL